MPFRSSSRIALCVAAALASVPAGAWAQTALRGANEAAAVNPTPLTATPDPTPARAVNPTPVDGDTALAAAAKPVDPIAPYYGKTRPRKPKLFKPDRKVSPPLPPLVPYRGAPGLSKTQINPTPAPRDAVDAAEPAPTVAVIPSPDRLKRPVVEEDPFAPLGVAAGTLRLFPFVEATTGYETNPNQTSSAVKASPLLRTEGGVDVRSDFSSNSLTASLHGGYSDYPGNTDANRPDAGGLVDARLDVTRNDKIDLEGRFSLATQTPGSPLLAVPGSVFITNRPTILTDGATLGGTHTFNRLSLNLRGTFDRTIYGDATQSDGSQLRFSQDNYNDYGVVGRAAYELTPALIPFVEVGADSRVRDNRLDLSGYARNSTGFTGRAGSTFEFSRLLTGAANVGYAERHYADARLTTLRGPTVDGALVYTFSPITKVTLSANTFLAETTLPGAAGAFSRSISLELAHIFFRNFTVSGAGTFQVNQYQGVSVNETFTQGTLKAVYSVSREIQINASATRQRLDSTLLGSSYTDNIFLVGMRLQR